MDKWVEAVHQLRNYIYVDENDFLREKCKDEQYLAQLIKEGERIVWEYDKEDRPIYLGYLGNLYRIKGDLKVALPYLERYKNYAIECNDEKEAIISLIRFAEALKYDKQYEESLAYFEEALERGHIVGENHYEHLAWQLMGKCYVEQGNMRQAEVCFLKALILRKEIGEAHLLEASTRALQFIMNIKK